MYLSKPPKIMKAAYSQLIWDMPNDNNTIYLTFDDGPTPEVTEWVLDLLLSRQITATFFCIGSNVEKHPELFNRLIHEGHQIGNHSYSHISGWKTENEHYFMDIEKAAKHIDSNLMRPPYGKITKSQAKHLNQYYNIIMWDVLSGDFDENTTPEKCLSNVIKHTKSGSIIVFHDSLKAFEKVKYALPKAIDSLLDAGYIFGKLV